MVDKSEKDCYARQWQCSTGPREDRFVTKEAASQ
jgi:hypothetical protein